jgi:hypothetical protein
VTKPNPNALREALRAASGPGGHESVATLPARLAAACVSGLVADGGGISLVVDDFRVPIGASDELATAAERLQFTLGEGPCLTTGMTQQILLADPEMLSARWPVYAEQLVEQSPFRSILTVPLALSESLHGAIDLFFVDPGRADEVRLVDVLVAQQEVTVALTGASLAAELASPAGPLARERLQVWIALGMLITELGVPAGDATDLLRAYAFSHDQTLDDVAAAMVAGDIDAERVRP